MTTDTTAGYLPEMQYRAVRLVLDGARDHPAQWVTISSVAPQIETPEPAHLSGRG